MRRSSHNFRDIGGHRFGRLTALKRVPRPEHITTGRVSYWLCRCDCGKECTIRSSHLTGGATVSCGCIKARHGHAPYGHFSRTYQSWLSAKSRCRNPKDTSFPNYGARGVTFSTQWDIFERFLADLGERPEGTSLDRIDNDKGYEPGNCRWATREEQDNNKSTTPHFKYKGTLLTRTQIARRGGRAASTVFSRLSRGWSVDDAVETPAFKPRGTRSG